MASVPTGIRAAYIRLTAAYGPVPLGVLASLIVATAAAWALTLHHVLSMSAPMSAARGGGMTADGMEGMESMVVGGMPAGGWSVSALAAFLAVWTVMMTAMMLPAIAPMVLIFASAQARRAKSVAVPTWIFVAGYVLVWAGAGLVVYTLVQMGTDLVGRSETLGRGMWGPVALGATLVLAGLYQLSPAKHVCLRHCRSPLAFVAQYWREGWTGAFGHGNPTRPLLSRLLLGPVCPAACPGDDEHRLDAPDHTGRVRREGASPRTTHRNRDWYCPRRTRDRRGRCRSLVTLNASQDCSEISLLRKKRRFPERLFLSHRPRSPSHWPRFRGEMAPCFGPLSSHTSCTQWRDRVRRSSERPLARREGTKQARIEEHAG
jgi:predicted metal-binding membrane protein